MPCLACTMMKQQRPFPKPRGRKRRAQGNGLASIHQPKSTQRLRRRSRRGCSKRWRRKSLRLTRRCRTKRSVSLPSFTGRKRRTIRVDRGCQSPDGWIVRRLTISVSCPKNGYTRGAGTQWASTSFVGSRIRRTCSCRGQWIRRSRSGISTTSAIASEPTWGMTRQSGTSISLPPAKSFIRARTTRMCSSGIRRLGRSFLLFPIERSHSV
mmetsp:Transcript_40301/g.96643  ORF Transcript_40301/g.96643 Transcript_40301/m.96643 type:complete len:210 (+) Transcript_40301:363-992(+)